MSYSEYLAKILKKLDEIIEKIEIKEVIKKMGKDKEENKNINIF